MIQEIVVSDNYIKTALNRSFVNNQIKMWEERIEDMYDLHYPRMFPDPLAGQLIYVSNHIDSLAMDIIEEREKLEQRKRSMYHELLIFDKTIAKYTPLERSQIKQFQASNDIHIPDIIDRLRLEMYEHIHREKQSKIDVLEKEIANDKVRRKAEGKARKKERLQKLKQERAIRKQLQAQ
ncbi:hypothetical protein [Staphylococcus saprophyticus]|uniref:hypothetical protein n=1 Tax=Staphylococcus saprophyticus TaxID=29385 RepID=UPI0008529FFE|nr:hypothetical protein [Staphylococcus saprophyticus]OEK44588.1 hypothetical protein ASS92_10980 [Staphylococcus saprophyticus]